MVQKNCVTNKIIVVAGPTGVGKSDYAVELALNYNGEVVNADSVQVYKGLNIGSGKITEEEMKGVPHHLLSFLEPSNQFTVVDYINSAKACIKDIQSRNKLPIIVGGTGFYINALLHNFDCGKTGPDYALRDELRRLENIYGKGYLADLLLSINPDSQIHPQDTTRVIRQLELYYSQESTKNEKEASDIDALLIIMDADRNLLDEKAGIRINKMISSGLIDEVSSLKDYYQYRCLDTIGYKEVKTGLLNNQPVDTIIANMKKSYHSLIKKQQTFFRWIKWDNKVIIYNWDYSSVGDSINDYLYGCK